MPTDTDADGLPVLLLDTSAAIALVLEDHDAHAATLAAVRGRRLGLAGHAWFEIFSVLTRLPAGLRRSPADAARMLAHNFQASVFLSESVAAAFGAELARLGIAGGSVYDALVGAAARLHGEPLRTRDTRAGPDLRRNGRHARFGPGRVMDARRVPVEAAQPAPAGRSRSSAPGDRHRPTRCSAAACAASGSGIRVTSGITRFRAATLIVHRCQRPLVPIVMLALHVALPARVPAGVVDDARAGCVTRAAHPPQSPRRRSAGVIGAIDRPGTVTTLIRHRRWRPRVQRQPGPGDAAGDRRRHVGPRRWLRPIPQAQSSHVGFDSPDEPRAARLDLA